MNVRIIDVAVPESSDEPGWEVEASAELANALEAEVWGNDDFATTTQQVASSLRHQENTLKRRYLAVDDVADPGPADLLGYASLYMPKHDNLTSANLFVGTRADVRRQGIGRALWEHALAEAAAHDRTVIQGWTGYPVEPAADDPNALAAPTGSGRVPGDDPATRFALAQGCVLEQAERHSVLDVPVDPVVLERFRAEAQERAGEDYAVVSWSDTVPEEWIDEYCVLLTRMSTDAPSAGLTVEEESWTHERVRSLEEQIHEQGMRTITVAALHRPSGELAGYTELAIQAHTPEAVFQDNTIVRHEHRGHRLGMLLKAANLQWLAEEHPQGRRVHTWNAEENDHMLSINVALGFRPAGGGAAFELRRES